MTATALEPVVAKRSLSNTVTFGTVSVSVLLSADETGGTFALMESVMRPGTEPPYHIHEREDETFYITEGHLSVMVDGTVHECRAGQTIFLPRGIPHTFRVRSSVARGLIMVSPGGFEEYFRAIGKPADSLEPPAEGQQMADYFEVAGRAAAQCGVRLAAEQPEF